MREIFNSVLVALVILLSANVGAGQSVKTPKLESNIRKELARYYGQGAEFDLTLSELGEVTLAGSVRSYWDKRNIHSIVARARGLKKITNQLQVLTRSVPDQTIKGNIEKDLQDNMAISKPREIGVEVKNGAVMLSGTVSFFRESVIAEDIASWQNGVVDVGNKLSVLPESEATTDEHLKTIIDDMLDRFFQADKNSIQATVVKAKVTVRGEVRTVWVKRQIGHEIARIQGVVRVENRLKISLQAPRQK